MPAIRSYEPGAPCWVDSVTDDVDASKGFYTGLFGWDAEDQFDPASGEHIYTLFLLGGRKVAGLGGKPPGFEQMPNVWNTSFATTDVEATVGRVADAGGQVVMPPLDVMDQGRMAACLDPTGAGFMLWQPGSMRGAEVVDEPGAFAWAELMTSDVASATSFYSTALGWTYRTIDMPDGMAYTLVEGGKDGIAGIMGRPDDVPDEVPDNWTVYFEVEDVNGTLAHAPELGASEAFGPMDVPTVGQIAGIVDPVGAVFSIITPQT